MLILLKLPKAADRKRKSPVYTDWLGRVHKLRVYEGSVTWPASRDGRFMTVVVSLRELARLAGLPFPMTNRQITSALRKHEQLIEDRARKCLAAVDEIFLGDGSLTRKRRKRPRPSAESSYCGPSLECYATPSAKKRRRSRDDDDFMKTGW